jgi:hypothetical protein
MAVGLTEIDMRVENAPYFEIDSKALRLGFGLRAIPSQFIAFDRPDTCYSNYGCYGLRLKLRHPHRP